jgi:antitoxin ParD1/3/4
MTISIPPELEKFLRDKVSGGQFSDETQVVVEAIQFFKAQDDLFRGDLEWLRKEIAVGLDEAERGLCTPFDAEEIKAEGRRLLASRDKRQP